MKLEPAGLSPALGGKSLHTQPSSAKRWRIKSANTQNSLQSRDNCWRGSVTRRSPFTRPVSSNSTEATTGNSYAEVPAYILISALRSSARAQYSSSSSYAKYTSWSPLASDLHFSNSVKLVSGIEGGPPPVPQA